MRTIIADLFGRIFCNFLTLFGESFVNSHLIRGGDGEVIRKIRVPGENPTGLALEGKRYLWHCDAYSAEIYKIDINTGEIKNSFKAPGSHPWGACLRRIFPLE
jgi:hypothetical protein